MRKTVRTLVVGLTGILALSLAGTALAAYTPKLTITGASQALGGPGGIKVKFQVPQTDDPTAKATFYVPAGYQLSTSGAPATKLGTSAAAVFAIDLGAVVPVTGAVEVANPADFAPQATACTGTATHSQTWVLRLSAAGTPLAVPVFVDLVPAASPLAALASAQLVICLPPPDVPAGTPGRATLGAKLITAEFTTSAITNPAAAGEYRWRATATPYTPGVGTPNAAATVEVQSLVRLPSQVTLRARVRNAPKRGFSLVTLTGTAPTGATVDLLSGGTAAKVKRFRSLAGGGAITTSLTVKQGTKASSLFLLARARTTDQDLGSAGCTATFVPPLSPFPIPCLAATVGGVTVSSPVVKVTIPAAPKKKPKR